MKLQVPSPSIPSQIARDLGIAIVSGCFKAGAVLDTEVDASGHRRVSRSAYREAMRILEAKGLVESRRRTGTRVRPQQDWQILDPEILSWLFCSKSQNKLVYSLFELRKLIEPEAARLAALRRSAAQLAVLEGALDVMEYATLDTNEGCAAEQSFHTSLLSASGNAFVAAMSGGVAAAVTWTTIFKQRTERPGRDSVPDHRLVYEAVAGRDPDLAYTAMAHLLELALSDAILRLAREPH